MQIYDQTILLCNETFTLGHIQCIRDIIINFNSHRICIIWLCSTLDELGFGSLDELLLFKSKLDLAEYSLVYEQELMLWG